MEILNGCHKVICVGDTMDGEAKKAWVIPPGGRLVVDSILDNVRIAFVDTSDGLRVAIQVQRGLIVR